MDSKIMVPEPSPTQGHEGSARPLTPGQRLYEACATAFSFRYPWGDGSAERRRRYERAANVFIASDPLLTAAPDLLEACRALLAETSAWGVATDATLAAGYAAIAKAEQAAGQSPDAEGQGGAPPHETEGRK